MKTELLYLQDPYLIMCKATVLAVEDDDVVLDRTPCFPRSGQQVGDTGRLGGAALLDTFLDGDGEAVIHRLGPDGTRPEVGAHVVVELDWARRHSVMRTHSLLQLATIAVERLHGPQAIAGAFVAPEQSHIDLAHSDELDLHAVALAVDAAIAADTPIEIALDPDDPQRRIWRTRDLPGVRCGGTHVRTTGEIGDYTLRISAATDPVRRLYAAAA